MAAAASAAAAAAPPSRPEVVGPDSGPEPPFPIRISGPVIKGFGRGSKELGIPTANLPISGLAVGGHENLASGVYFGFAGLAPCLATHQHPLHSESKYHHMATHLWEDLLRVMIGSSEFDDPEEKSSWTHDKGAVYPMVMSVGWNPYYKNERRSVEVHLLHHFDRDFYGVMMNLVVLGFVREEKDYASKEELVKDIRTDVDVAWRSLRRKAYLKFAKDNGLLKFEEGKGEEEKGVQKTS